MITKDSSDIGLKTRFGPDWPGKRCGAKTRAGGICPKPAYKDSGRCQNHGGASTGAKTKEGRQRLSEAHLKHGHYTKDKKQARKEGAVIERKLRAQRKRIESELTSAGFIQ